MEDKASFGGIYNNFFFKTLKFLVQRFLKTFFSFEVVNIHQVPTTGPFIIAANHFSFMDTPVLQAACPRRIHFLMAEEYYYPILGRWFFKLMGAIPVHENPFLNIGPVKRALKILIQSNVIGIFPAGHISKKGAVQKEKPGAAFLAKKTNAPILPVFISGTYQILPISAKFFHKGNIKVFFGNLLTYEDLSEELKGKNGLNQATQNLFQKIRVLSSKNK